MYAAFASVYDRLMADVDYPAWAAFYQGLLTAGGIPRGMVCECACGTGSLTLLLAAQGYQITGVDASADMLFEASQKARRAGAMIPFVKQDMRSLRLHRRMDAVLCTNDGVNYLAFGNDLLRFFIASFDALRPGGLLAFDLSTPYKLEHELGDRFLGEETPEVAYLWQNHWNGTKKYVDLDLTLFARQPGGLYARIEEHQRQYAHTWGALQGALSQVGFTDIALYGDLHMQAPGPEEARWHITARRPIPEEENQPEAPLEEPAEAAGEDLAQG